MKLSPSLRLSVSILLSASLAVADGMVGFLMLISVLANVGWVMNMSLVDFEYYSVNSDNSPYATFVGALIDVSTTVWSLFRPIQSWRK